MVPERENKNSKHRIKYLELVKDNFFSSRKKERATEPNYDPTAASVQTRRRDGSNEQRQQQQKQKKQQQRAAQQQRKKKYTQKSASASLSSALLVPGTTSYGSGEGEVGFWFCEATRHDSSRIGCSAPTQSSGFLPLDSYRHANVMPIVPTPCDRRT